jgi:copper chaperone
LYNKYATGMEKIKFRTNIKCSSCVAKVAPALNEGIGKGKWQIDISDTSKVLTVDLPEEDNEKVLSLISKAGFKS